MKDLTDYETRLLAEMETLAQFRPAVCNKHVYERLKKKYDWVKPWDSGRRFITSEAPVRGLFCGNRAGKDCHSMVDLSYRILGVHPVKWRNLQDNDVVRCASPSKPLQEGDVQNAQYPEFKKWLPNCLIKQDVTFRSSVMTVELPGRRGMAKIEFVSFDQDTQRVAGQVRKATYVSEECSEEKWDEYKMRHMSSLLDMTVAVTVISGMSWMYADIWQASENNKNIEVFNWPTDANPVLDEGNVERIFTGLEEDDIRIRRFGQFKQMIGAVYKEFDFKIHSICIEDYFPKGIPDHYQRYLIIDYHQRTPWAISFIAISPENEWFVYDELWLDPAKYVTWDIAARISHKLYRSPDPKYGLIDPLACHKQSNTGRTVLGDLKKALREMGHNFSIYPADTKGGAGRERIKERFYHANIAKKPFNNEGYLPTLWISNTCHNHIYQIRNFIFDEYTSQYTKAKNDPKNNVQNKNSHFPVNLEFLAKKVQGFYVRPPMDKHGHTFYRIQKRTA